MICRFIFYLSIIHTPRTWLVTASQVPGFIGFAVGRTDFWSALVDWGAKKGARAEAVNRIANRYLAFAQMFEVQARAA